MLICITLQMDVQHWPQANYCTSLGNGVRGFWHSGWSDHSSNLGMTAENGHMVLCPQSKVRERQTTASTTCCGRARSNL